ncbi:hypothetical protein [Nevskia sp.]|uniref:alpha/beta hydrolase family protein n=1 Tax=Nevskia sp. TaxID=1929292 RepID=UPI0025D06498|nr:hypothetical protein [Nevskia sp.]
MSLTSIARGVLAAISAVLLAACGGGGTTITTPPPAQAAALYVGNHFNAALASSAGDTCGRILDATRSREITVQIRVPQASSTRRPIIVFSHGGGPRDPCSFGNPEWGRSLSEAGYVVMHIAHSLTSFQKDAACSAIGVTDCSVEQAMQYHRPLDVQSVLAAIPTLVQSFQIAAIADTGRVGLAGHSFGAFTVMAVAGARHDLGTLRDIDRSVGSVRSVLALSPQGPGRFGFYDRGVSGGNSWDAIGIPVMTQTGAADVTNGEDAPSRRVPFTLMPPPDKAELFINDSRAQHETFNLNDSSAPALLLDTIRSTAIAYFDATLQERQAAWEYLRSDNIADVSNGIATLNRRDLIAPAGQ